MESKSTRVVGQIDEAPFSGLAVVSDIAEEQQFIHVAPHGAKGLLNLVGDALHADALGMQD